MRSILQTASSPSRGQKPDAEVRRTDVVLRPAAVAMAFLGAGQPHEPIAVPGVALAPDDVLVAIEMSTICGSDVHTVQGRRASAAPLVLGHESVGRIMAIGAAGAGAADGTPLHIGDRVVWSVTVSCGTCDRCSAGLTQKCRSLGKYGHERIAPHRELTGGYASHAQLRRGTAIVRVPEALPAAALAPASCATATAMAAVDRAAWGRELEGRHVRVHGAGLVGLSAVAIAASRGARIEVSDPNPERRALAARFGAAPEGIDGEPDVVIEASGRYRKKELLQPYLDQGVGRVVVLMEHVAKGDAHKILKECTLPLTGVGVVDRIITDLGVLDVTPEGLQVVELAPGVGFAEVQAKTGAVVKAAKGIAA